MGGDICRGTFDLPLLAPNPDFSCFPLTGVARVRTMALIFGVHALDIKDGIFRFAFHFFRLFSLISFLSLVNVYIQTLYTNLPSKLPEPWPLQQLTRAACNRRTRKKPRIPKSTPWMKHLLPMALSPKQRGRIRPAVEARCSRCTIARIGN